MRYCVVLLALCFAVRASAQAPAPREKGSATVIDAERIEGVGELEVTASGNAEIRHSFRVPRKQ
jgi:hypothetical protein